MGVNAGRTERLVGPPVYLLLSTWRVEPRPRTRHNLLDHHITNITLIKGERENKSGN